jgi:hypothetical protein
VRFDLGTQNAVVIDLNKKKRKTENFIYKVMKKSVIRELSAKDAEKFIKSILPLLLYFLESRKFCTNI